MALRLRCMHLDLAPEDIDLILEALDSHAYWQLSEPELRRDGFVDDPGAHEVEAALAIAHTRALIERLEPFRRTARS